MNGREIAICIVAVMVAAGAFFLGRHSQEMPVSPQAVSPSRVVSMIRDLESQGEPDLERFDEILRLGDVAVKPLLQHGIPSEKDHVRLASLEMLEILAWLHPEGEDLMGLFLRLASDRDENEVMRQAAARAWFSHRGRPPEGWEAFLSDDGALRFRAEGVTLSLPARIHTSRNEDFNAGWEFGTMSGVEGSIMSTAIALTVLQEGRPEDLPALRKMLISQLNTSLLSLHAKRDKSFAGYPSVEVIRRLTQKNMMGGYARIRTQREELGWTHPEPETERKIQEVLTDLCEKGSVAE
jgi:hypothetical protein